MDTAGSKNLVKREHEMVHLSNRNLDASLRTRVRPHRDRRQRGSEPGSPQQVRFRLAHRNVLVCDAGALAPIDYYW